MSIFGTVPAVGDWVRATRTIPTTMTDRLLDSGLAPGTRGVVLSRTGTRVTVDFDAGWGTQRVTVPAAHCQVVRRGAGTTAFYRKNRQLTAARIGLALVLAFPVIEFVAQYVLATHGVHGLMGALAVGAAQSILDTMTGFLAHPVKSLLYFAILAVMSRLAFGRRQ